MQRIIKHKRLFPNIVHGFFGKHPDIVLHQYRSNKDTTASRNKILKLIKSKHSHISLLKQTHSINCVELNKLEDINYEREGDAQVTKNSDVILAVYTADCVPVLFSDQTAGIVGIAHAGWKGALNGVVNSTLQTMAKLGANIDNIISIIGPCIRFHSYEVSEDFINPFLLQDVANSKFFKKSKKNKEKYFFDLPGYVIHTLARAHIKKIYDTEIDTLTNPSFFSYRQACLAQNKLVGRNLSFIGLK